MTRIEQLLNELRERKPVCTCGAVAYPRTWMAKTREKAVQTGVLRECNCRGACDNVLLLLPHERDASDE